MKEGHLRAQLLVVEKKEQTDSAAEVDGEEDTLVEEELSPLSKWS